MRHVTLFSLLVIAASSCHAEAPSSSSVLDASSTVQRPAICDTPNVSNAPFADTIAPTFHFFGDLQWTSGIHIEIDYQGQVSNNYVAINQGTYDYMALGLPAYGPKTFKYRLVVHSTILASEVTTFAREVTTAWEQTQAAQICLSPASWNGITGSVAIDASIEGTIPGLLGYSIEKLENRACGYSGDDSDGLFVEPGMAGVAKFYTCASDQVRTLHLSLLVIMNDGRDLKKEVAVPFDASNHAKLILRAADLGL